MRRRLIERALRVRDEVCFSKKTSVAACARMFISIWSTEERMSATSLIGWRECSEIASRLVEI